jgi:phosphoglycerate dehydrogenase-like enzyme
MKKPLLAIGTKIVEPYLSKIEKHFTLLPFGHVLKQGSYLSENDVRIICRGANVVLLEAETVSKETLQDWKEHGLSLLICTRGNPVNVDVSSCQELGIQFSYTPGRNAQSVAEFTFALILMLSKQLHRSTKAIWDRSLTDNLTSIVNPSPKVDDVVWMNDQINAYAIIPLGEELYGKTLAIIGFGSIGQRVARIATAFNMRVLVYDPYCPEEMIKDYNAQVASLFDILNVSDYISLHMAVTPETVGIVDKRWFDNMKKGSKLINTARASLVKQDDFIEALQTGKISGAAVDVMWQEPCPANHPFLNMDQVIVSPHVAGHSVDVDLWQSLIVWEDLECFLSGKPLKHPYPTIR